MCGHKAERALFFLGVVQAQDRVEPVQQSPELDDVLRLDRVVVDVAEEPPQPLSAQAPAISSKSVFFIWESLP